MTNGTDTCGLDNDATGKASGGRDDKKSGISSRSRAVRGDNRRKMELVKLLETRWITEVTTRTNQGPDVTIMVRTSNRIKNDTTMISNLTNRKELQVKLRYMRNKWHMKLGSAKSAMANNRKRGIINSLN
jgi:hypothetical protein